MFAGGGSHSSSLRALKGAKDSAQTLLVLEKSLNNEPVGEWQWQHLVEATNVCLCQRIS